MLLPGDTWINAEGVEKRPLTAINKSQKESFNNDTINKICQPSMQPAFQTQPVC